jgi:hypothetical protein
VTLSEVAFSDDRGYLYLPESVRAAIIAGIQDFKI